MKCKFAEHETQWPTNKLNYSQIQTKDCFSIIILGEKHKKIITRTVRQDALSLNLGKACTDKAF